MPKAGERGSLDGDGSTGTRPIIFNSLLSSLCSSRQIAWDSRLRCLVQSSSEWLRYQWIHLVTLPKTGQPSRFWAQNGGTSELPERIALKIASLLHRTRVNHLLTRLFDGIGAGDSQIFVLRHTLMDTVHVLLPGSQPQESDQVVRCLKMQTYPEIRLILIDDGSTDGTQEVVRQEYPSAEFIQGDGTWWWAGCLQRGFDRLKQMAPRSTDIVLLANDDTTFDRYYIERAVNFSVANNVMLLSRIRNPATGIVEEAGVLADLRTMSFQETREPASINCLSTRGLFLRWDDMKIAGGFHPLLLPHYWSDYEYTIRAMRKGLKGVTTESVWLKRI